MGNYNRDNDRFSRGGGGGFKRRDFNDRPSRGPVEMHDAVCDNCGKSCQVPFRPTSGKPVYCSNCFEQKNGGSDNRRFEGRNSGRPNFEQKSEGGNQEQFNVLNQKLDHILRILESAPVVEKKKRVSKVEPAVEEVSVAADDIKV